MFISGTCGLTVTIVKLNEVLLSYNSQTDVVSMLLISGLLSRIQQDALVHHKFYLVSGSSETLS